MMTSPMMSDQFCLRWNNFQTNIVNALDSLKCSEDLVDVTLTCEGKNIKAHKVILSACSPYFRTVFKENPCQHPIIILKDVLAEDIINLLSYMYQGEVFIEESRLSSFLHTAALLQVKGLTEVPQQGRETTTECSPTNKLYTQLTISPKTNTSQKDLNKIIKHHKKRRNSASDRLGDTPINDGGKKSKAGDMSEGNSKADHSSVVHEAISRSESDASTRLTESADDKLTDDKNESATSQHVKPALNQSRCTTDDVQVKIKTEANDPSAKPTPPDDFTPQNDDSNSDHPEYETSMLARSLLAGTHSVKSDANANITPTKPKLVAKIDVAAPQRSRDSTAKIVTHKHSLPLAEDQIKAERLSPKPVSMDLEPEVVISEHESMNTDMYIQDRSQAGISLAGFGPGASSLQVHAQANHAAICGDCPHCGTKYSNQSALKYHVRLMHSDLTNRLCCYLCPRSFTMRDTFKEHMWSTHGQRN